MLRGWMSDPIFGNEPFTWAQAYQWLVENAVYKAGIKNIGGEFTYLQRGELSYSLRFLEGVWGWKKDKIRRFLISLQKLGYIQVNPAISSATGRKIITVCCYDDIQGTNYEGATQKATAMRQWGDISTTNRNKENKEIKRNNNIGTPQNWKNSLEDLIGSDVFSSDFQGVSFKDGILIALNEQQLITIKRNHLEVLFTVFGSDLVFDLY